MAKQVVGMFDSSEHAHMALRDLRDAGFSDQEIGLVGSNKSGSYDPDHAGAFDKEGDGLDAGEGASFGATSGALMGGIGGLLAGLGALAIPGIGPVIAGGTLGSALLGTAVGAGVGAASGSLIGALVGAGIPERDAEVYAEGVRRGGSVLSVYADNDEAADRAVAIMQRHGVVDIDRRATEYRQAGWTGFDENASYDNDTYNTASTATTSDYNTNTTATNNYSTTAPTGETKIPIIEEQVQVGKQSVETGGVRVHTRVEERPVNAQVNLREEHVDIHRKPVDRPVSDADVSALQEGTFEVRERIEQPVVEKQARVVEELHVKKNVTEHTQNVQDTVRRTDVDVEQLPGSTRAVNDTTSSYTSGTTSGTHSHDEGTIERGASKLGNSVERGLGADLDNDGDVGQRDPRNNI